MTTGTGIAMLLEIIVGSRLWVWRDGLPTLLFYVCTNIAPTCALGRTRTLIFTNFTFEAFKVPLSMLPIDKCLDMSLNGKTIVLEIYLVPRANYEKAAIEVKTIVERMLQTTNAEIVGRIIFVRNLTIVHAIFELNKQTHIRNTGVRFRTLQQAAGLSCTELSHEKFPRIITNRYTRIPKDYLSKEFALDAHTLPSSNVITFIQNSTICSEGTLEINSVIARYIHTAENVRRDSVKQLNEDIRTHSIHELLKEGKIMATQVRSVMDAKEVISQMDARRPDMKPGQYNLTFALYIVDKQTHNIVRDPTIEPVIVRFDVHESTTYKASNYYIYSIQPNWSKTTVFAELAQTYNVADVKDINNWADFDSRSQIIVLDEYGPSNKLNLEKLKTLADISATRMNMKTYGASKSVRADAIVVILSNMSPWELYGKWNPSLGRHVMLSEHARQFEARFKVFRLDGDKEEDRITHCALATLDDMYLFINMELKHMYTSIQHAHIHDDRLQIALDTVHLLCARATKYNTDMMERYKTPRRFYWTEYFGTHFTIPADLEQTALVFPVSILFDLYQRACGTNNVARSHYRMRKRGNSSHNIELVRKLYTYTFLDSIATIHNARKFGDVNIDTLGEYACIEICGRLSILNTPRSIEDNYAILYEHYVKTVMRYITELYEFTTLQCLALSTTKVTQILNRWFGEAHIWEVSYLRIFHDYCVYCCHDPIFFIPNTLRKVLVSRGKQARWTNISEIVHHEFEHVRVCIDGYTSLENN